jgi:hypothetical protein
VREFLQVSSFDLDDKGNMFLRNVGLYPNYIIEAVLFMKGSPGAQGEGSSVLESSV